MKKILLSLLFLVLAIVIGVVFFGIYWKNLSREEQWLLFHKGIASQYAKELLVGRPTQKTPDELVDMLIMAEKGIVTFEPHEQDRYFVLAYSPNHAPDPVQSDKPPKMATWRKLQKDWYALNIKSE